MSDKKYELVFEHPSGLILTILTDDIYGLSEQQWFAQFFQDAQLYVPPEGQQQQEEELQMPMTQVQQVQQHQPPQQPSQQMRQVQRQTVQDPYGASVNPAMQRVPQQQVQPVQAPRMKSFLDISTESMNMDIWNQLNSEQKAEWQRKWLK